MNRDQARRVLARLVRSGRVSGDDLRRVAPIGADIGALISPADYLARLEQVNTYIRALDRDIRRAYAERRVTDRPFREEWERWFGDWTEFYGSNNSWWSGMTGGALQQVEEHNTAAQGWRERFVGLAGAESVTTPTAPTPGGPADRAAPLLGDGINNLATVAGVAIAAVAILWVFTRVSR